MKSTDGSNIETFYCTSCGTRVRKSDMYCPICGNKLDNYGYTKIEDEIFNDNNYSKEKLEPEESQGPHIGKTIGVFGSLFIIVSSFLPYASFKILGFGDTIHLIDKDDGIIFLISGIILLLLFCANSKVLSFFASIAICGAVYYEYNATKEVLYEMGIFAGMTDMQAGFYLLIIGAILSLIGAILSSSGV